jgi:heme-degrading monooxygenase HmoA
MILETALITVKPGLEEDFLAALPRGIAVLEQAHGFIDVEVHQGIERSEVFALHLRWATLEDHTVRFRESALFTQWREVISPFFMQPPVVEHWTAHDVQVDL